MKENDFKLKQARSRRHPGETIKNADYEDSIVLLANTHSQTEFLLHSLMQAAGGIDLHVNADQKSTSVLIQKETSPLEMVGL